MEWYYFLLIIIGSLLLLFLTGLPVAFSFMIFNIIGAFFILGGEGGLIQYIRGMVSTIDSFALLSLPLFVIMGSIIFESGLVTRMLDIAEQWIGRLPGRLAVVSVAIGAVFGTMSGSTMAATSVLGSALLPEMLKRGYKKSMSIGPIMGAASLSMIIPPSGIGIILAAVANISIAELFMAAYIPGFLMAGLFAVYIIIRCAFQPHLAPSYIIPKTTLAHKLNITVRGAVPILFIIFAVMGLMFLGIATPTESAAMGTVAALILAAIYKKLNKKMIYRCLRDSALITSIMLLILVGAQAFGQVVNFTGVLRGLTALALAPSVAPMLVVIFMLLVIIVMGTFMDDTSLIMLTIPIYMPIILALHLDPIWFGVLALIALTQATISPPFGMIMFVMKSMSPPDISLGDIFRATIPYNILDIITMALVLIFPVIALWLPTILGNIN
jgi:tripartite ATP-independent transporter DctM subunit